MRYLVLDTETTGLETAKGNRVVEIGLVEIVNRQLTGRTFHHYLNPDRDSEPGAFEKHGLTTEFLADKPRFTEIAEDLLAFIEASTLIIHNAVFDIGFLDYELKLVGRAPLKNHYHEVIDTLLLARELHPGKRNTLDALCDRYGIDNTHRTYHGALLDAKLLGDVYLAMTRGQEALIVDEHMVRQSDTDHYIKQDRTALKVVYATLDELDEHQQQLLRIDKDSKGQCLWSQRNI
ncbi:MAG: DNA polymerase III subunit epsilon [Ferrovum sp. 37-45-19]|uniref:DNA polymerase III subunit epsilon n=1 Tax=Ferrovum sp. JA12 TaxID=1356299 RepID=UPI0007030721|nr:DNA polymerase III subunit epsilon [Ferrovum sp. JA12]OYV79307.1 MAG: DNA polymerase III subunit epsilon [Ferrovum sp. 21-44-67]OYV94138.1 MAG: DNA polymerase III subunit epsilon [Ferrovum sp. 37-45-19]OZB34314.1 MAG: DNA polymerase III subunit epsilon [Ferrovum sp. 34-44-207]HQT81404.1 DNA polymerase III subunit epsilon [Ferrovaceae bacterium]KRH78506.1 DNA polymerase III subunit epsilon [Ferrovum sp. JA12]